jgi:hypothetical protein
MSLDVEPKTGTPSPPRRSRARWLVVAAAVAVVVVAAVSSLVLWLGEDDNGHTDGGLRADPSAAAPSTAAPSGQASQQPSAQATPSGGQGGVTRLTLSPQPARCMVPSVDRLRTAVLAFQGTVAKIGSKAVLLDVSRWLHADGFGGTNTVRIALPAKTTESPVTFRPGTTYLVAATGDAQVMSCGLSGEKSADLAKMYADAF